jgi:hypothetical protein
MIMRIGLEWVFWAGAALSIWLLTLASLNGADLAVASASGAFVGVAAVVARRVLGIRLDPSPRVLRWLVRLPVSAVHDTVTVLSYPWLHLLDHDTEGEWKRVPVQPGPDPRDSTNRALATLLVSSTPDSFVVHADTDTGELVIHVLAGGGMSMHEAVRR